MYVSAGQWGRLDSPGAGGLWDITVPSVHFHCEPESASKN